MISATIQKELREYLGDRKLGVLLFLTLLLTLVASLDGWQRVSQQAELFDEVSDIERETWLNQGEANPHDAAHFGRYALRKIPALSAFDPGILDYSGSSVWMEAHFQNPPSIRHAESRIDSYPLAFVTPSWILSVVVPLLLVVLLFGTVVVERKRRTLNLLWVQNARPIQLLLGKLATALLIAAALAVFLVSLSCIPIVLFRNVAVDWSSVLALVICFFVAYSSICGCVILISTIARSRHIAFWLASLLWVFMVFSPIVVAQAAKDLHPVPRDREFAADIQREAQAPFWLGRAQYEEVAIYEAEIMTRYRALDAQQLGLNRDALVLQAHERFANRVYDRLYGELHEIHEQQESMLRVASIFSPILALQRVSRGIAGTDTNSQIHFAKNAEMHRRSIIEKLNEDMLLNAGEDSFRYVADQNLWQIVDDFEYEKLSLSETLQRYRLELVSLALWALMSLVLAAVVMQVRARAETK